MSNESGVRPLGNRLLVQRVKVEESVSRGGVVLPQTHDEAGTCKAEILDLGPDVSNNVKVGDLILHTLFAGDPVENETGKYLLLEEPDVLAIMDRA